MSQEPLEHEGTGADREPAGRQKNAGRARPPRLATGRYTRVELEIALEELRVAEEELRQQNEALAAAQEAIERERRRYQELFELAPDGYLVTDANGQIREANRAAGTLLNVPHARLVDKLLVQFVPITERPLFRSALNRISRVDQRQEIDISLQPRGGGRLDAALTAVAVRDRDGAFAAVRWLLRDVSERKRLEELRRRAETLAEADRLKSALLSVVSHDLKTPLAAIKASIAGLNRRLGSISLPLGAGDALTGIEEGTDRLTALVSNLLDLTRLESGAWQPAREWHLLEEILGTVLARFEDKEAERIQACLPAEVPMVYVDGVQVAQVFWNILDNALKYAPEGTPVAVSARPVGALTKDGSPDAVQVSIRDRGPGLSADERELIFEPFYRSDAHAETSTAARPKAPGSGLGLAICRGLVEAHGGRIWVECDNEAGASFHFTLPSPGDGARPRLLGDEPLPRGES